MTHDCDLCGRRFGGTFGFDRHLDRRKDRCRADRELRARGLRRREDGVWVQTSSFFRQLRLWREKSGRKPPRPQGRGTGAHEAPHKVRRAF
jgi:hypothetical protein